MRSEHQKEAVLAILAAAASTALALSACAAPQAKDRATPTSAVSEPAETSEAVGVAPLVPATAAEAPGAGSCQAPADPLPSLTEGPYFKEGSPQRTSLIKSETAGQRLLLSGSVYDTDCALVSGAQLDFWQADGNGVYDNAGFGLRGHQFTDSAGRYQLITVIPGLYPGRTEHIHVKVETPSGVRLTTQLFFPDVEGNQMDGFFDARLMIQMAPEDEGWVGRFDFVVSGS